MICYWNIDIYLEIIEIFQFCLMVLHLWRAFTPMGGCMDGFVDGWVKTRGQVKSLKFDYTLTHNPKY